MPAIGIGVYLGRASKRPGGPAAPNPKTILGSALIHWARADFVTLNGSSVSAMTDLSGAGNPWSQGTAANQPAYTASDATLNNQATMRFDGSNDSMSSAFNPPTAATVEVWIIAKSITWTGNDVLFGTQAVGNCTVFQGGASPQYAMYGGSGANVNGGVTLGNWARIRATFTSSTSDAILVKATTVTGTSAGFQASVSSELGHGAELLGFADFQFAEIWLLNRASTGPERTSLDSYIDSRYGAGLTS